VKIHDKHPIKTLLAHSAELL